MPESDRRRRGGKGEIGRHERLVAELRANLKRRKDRERAVEQSAKAGTPDSERENGGST